MLVLAAVLAPALAGGEGEPLTHVGDLGGPAAIQIAEPVASAEAVDDGSHLQELGLGVGRVVGAGQRALGAGAQRGLEVADLGVGIDLRLQHDVAARVVVDLRQRLVDARDAVADGFAFASELGVELRDLVDRVDVEQLLETALEARQIVGTQTLEHAAVLGQGLQAGIDLGGVELVGVLESRHRLDDALGSALQALALGVDLRLQLLAQRALAALAGLHRQRLPALVLLAQRLDPARHRVVHRHGDTAGLFGHRLSRLLARLQPTEIARQRVERLITGPTRRTGELELARELAQRVARRLQPRMLVAQPRHGGGAGAPVDGGPVAEGRERGQRLELAPQRSDLALGLGDDGPGVGDLALEGAALRLQCGELGLVAPAEHVAAAVVQAVAVVLLVALARRLDLAGAGERARLAPELFGAVATGQVEALRELALEPVVQRRVGAQGQLVQQRLRIRLGHVGAPWRSAPEVHQPRAQRGAVDPRRHIGVVRIGHQQRQPEAVQHALGRPFPSQRVLAHLD